jgi:seryl-tRNA synthetase
MDLRKTIQDLYAEKEKLERVIASLEELQRAADANSQVLGRTKRRGRKSMGSQERQEVSERMKKYWASRRSGGRKKSPPASDARTVNGN